MFSSLALFKSTPCPDKASCTRPNCLFSHRPDLPPPPPLVTVSNAPATASSLSRTTSAIPSKRPAAPSPVRTPSGLTGEPPRKLQIVGPASGRKPVPAKSSATPAVSHRSQYCSPICNSRSRSLARARPFYRLLLQRLVSLFQYAR